MSYFLKYVEIDNFKSYKGHIVIGPLRKFTAIIGPNGSGKSNLMDAISFVLGEPTKSLRVRKLSELIHGAPINKPVSTRASVSLIFVTIKTDRHGERTEHEKRFQRLIVGNASEYRVDGRQLSATEYTEELENMGIIPKAKNFLIFQGQVESIAMKTPKEFTAMFEELSRSGELKEEYEQAKQEKNKAEQDTHANFQKKKGVEKQKKEVRLEKEVAQKYAALKTQYDELQLQLKLFQLYHNKQELTEKREIADKKRDEVAKLEKRKEISDEEIKAKKKELAVYNKELANDEQKVKELEAQINKNRPTYIKAKENSTHHQKKLDLARKTLLAAEKCHSAHNDEIVKYDDDLREVERLRREYEDKLQDESQHTGRNLALEENQMKEYRRLKEEAAKKMTQFSEEYDSIDRQQQVDKTNVEQEQRSQKDHQARIKQTESRIEELNGKIDKLGGYIADLEREFNEKQTNVQLLEREVTEGRKRCGELEEELDQVNKEIGEARSDRNETSRAQRRAELIENLKQFPGVYGRLIDLCEPTHKRFQMAITKVLGRNMDSIVVERETTVQSCLRYMKEHRYEPETFLPLDYIKVTPVNEQLRELQEPKNVKLVLDVIKYDKQYYKALLYACGNALVCDSDDDARRLAYESGHHKNKVVSLNGTLFNSSTVSNGDGNNSSQCDSKQIYDMEDKFELNYKRLRDDLKKINYEQVDKEEKLLIKQMADIEAQLQKHLPQTSAIDARSREVKTTFELTNAEFERARNAAKRARQAFEKIKKERYDRFNALYEHVSTCIDDIYKSLTNSQAAVACLTAEDAEEPYKGGITYNCVAPGKRFQAMENLSGGEKTVAAICLLFALRSFKPAPFFLLDEVDAALDNTNIGKVADFIREQSASEFQCIVISLKEQFYSRADALVGIYPEPGDCITSHCLTLDLNQFDERENVANTRG
ncbi:unnamed protein product [Rotaria magnacalcarata]|uniref:SMC hinge domain-containing protein n=1 Tax=Rotaria magnacalcarata TaxID=392030 RepID=A0A816BZW2_9BILA|nr:unnamed protein product [Rotaria magnacalcarata]